MQEKKAPVFVVATANEVRALPPELLRKGRFDEIFFVDLPDPHERLEILDIHLRQRNRNPEQFDLTVVVEESERYSGAELEQVVVGAMFKSYADGREVDTDDLIDSVREIVPLAVTMDDQLKDLRDWARSRAREPVLIDAGPIFSLRGMKTKTLIGYIHYCYRRRMYEDCHFGFRLVGNCDCTTFGSSGT